MNRINKIATVMLLLFATIVANADDNVFVDNVFVELSTTCDSAYLWIGEQTDINIAVTCDVGQKVTFPEYRDTIVRNLEVIPPARTDTSYIDRKKRMTVTRTYTVTAFDSAFFYIPPIQVFVDSVPFRSGTGIPLAVYMIDVDTLNTDQFNGPKDIISEPVQWQDIRLSVFSLLVFAVIGFLAVLLFISWKNDKPIIRIVKVEPKKPAHEVAIQEIERIRQEQLAHGEDAKTYYTQLTDAVRIYMNSRFGFNATEMTSDEIIEHLMEQQDKDSLAELRELLMTADLVKFAKMKPLLGDNDRNLVTAMEFVRQTMLQEQPEETKSEQQIVVESKRSKQARTVILIGSIVAGLASCFFLFVLIREIYYLFF